MKPPAFSCRIGLVVVSLFFAVWAGAAMRAAVLTADASAAPAVPAPLDLGQGADHTPDGRTLTADGWSFLLDGRRFIPVSGEFHFSRYPREEWRDELLKMKAGGINIVSTYVFWIHHEEVRGTFDWSGRRDLRAFLELIREVGLMAIVRLGPWDHGEVRNGGFPDWVRDSGTKLRSADPAFLELVRPFYREIARQMQGQYWKDGGPIIGVQLENECNGLPYLVALKQLARECGADVPFYTMTGWDNVAVPEGGLLPLFGAYSVAFWYPPGNPAFKKSFVFSAIRDEKEMAPDFHNLNPARSALIGKFPFLCCEIGGGMPSAYLKRVKVEPDEIAAMALAKLGSGNNMPGYYMYQGGVNPEGRLSYLNEAAPNAMPVKDYDFQAPLGALGQVRGQYHLLRQQHLFLQDFGIALAGMPLTLPDRRPANLGDLSVLRWSVRSDSRSAFVFFNNYQPQTTMPDHTGVQFQVKLAGGTVVVPQEPITIPAGRYGILPVNLDCGGVLLQYATVQPLCRLTHDGAEWYFFAQIPGLAPELAFAAGSVKKVEATRGSLVRAGGLARVKDFAPGLEQVVAAHSQGGAAVRFVVLAAEQARQLYRLPFGGRDRLVLVDAAALADGDALRLQTVRGADLSLAVFPSGSGLILAGREIAGRPAGVFTQFSLPTGAPPECGPVVAKLVRPAAVTADPLDGSQEAAWAQAEAWSLVVPAALTGRRVVLHIDYAGDAARLYAGDTFVLDNYANGDAMEVGLWRLPAEALERLTLLRLPFGPQSIKRLPPVLQSRMEERLAATKAPPRISVSEQVDLSVRVVQP